MFANPNGAGLGSAAPTGSVLQGEDGDHGDEHVGLDRLADVVLITGLETTTSGRLAQAVGEHAPSSGRTRAPRGPGTPELRELAEARWRYAGCARVCRRLLR